MAFIRRVLFFPLQVIVYPSLCNLCKSEGDQVGRELEALSKNTPLGLGHLGRRVHVDELQCMLES